jgi:hypothetical protein
LYCAAYSRASSLRAPCSSETSASEVPRIGRTPFLEIRSVSLFGTPAIQHAPLGCEVVLHVDDEQSGSCRIQSHGASRRFKVHAFCSGRWVPCHLGLLAAPPNGLGVQLRPTAAEAATAPKERRQDSTKSVEASVGRQLQPLVGQRATWTEVGLSLGRHVRAQACERTRT